MKRQTILSLAGLLFSCSIAFAQTATPGSGPNVGNSTAPGAPAARQLTPAQQANRDRIQGERQTCRNQAMGQGLKGPAIRTAVVDCMKNVDPVVAHRMECVQAGRAQNLSGDDLRRSVRGCMQST